MNYLTILVATMVATSAATTEKRLIFVAGPRRSDSSEVYQFFDQHATGGDQNGLKGWVWPQIKEELPGEKHQSFENFFWNSHNDTIKAILMESIQHAWDTSGHGIIVGAEGFDNTRGAPESIGLKTMNEIANALEVEPENVYVVMLYKAPRLEQWINLFHHNNELDDYKDFVCGHEYSEHLANIPMNPFMLANVYRGQGWNVAVIDTVGARRLGKDIGHSIACEILPLTACENGWIQNLENERVKEEVIELAKFTGLPAAKKSELEGLFEARDCFYREALESDNAFHPIHKEAMWEKCESSDLSKERYEQLNDPEVFFDLVRNQVGCGALPLNASFNPIINNRSNAPPDYKSIVMWCAVALIALFVSVQFALRFKKRPVRIVRSPRTGEEICLDFNDGTFQINLRSPSHEDDSFTDVDLKSPKAGSIEQNIGPNLDTPEVKSNLSDAARRGHSVRHVYGAGQYESVSNTSRKPRNDDSDLEFQIKSLEADFA